MRCRSRIFACFPARVNAGKMRKQSMHMITLGYIRRCLRRNFSLASFTAACLIPLAAVAAESSSVLSTIAQRQDECVRPDFRSSEVVPNYGTGGYGIEVKGERYWVSLAERQTFSLIDRDGETAVVQLRLEHAAPNEFAEQAVWRERWLEDVAERAGSLVHRRALAGEAYLLTVNKNAMTGKFAGLSVLVAPQQQFFVQWNWHLLSRYQTPQDLVEAQDKIWKRAIPCLLK